ncbi:MAG: alpha-hydroxy-acid oxidizing protein [Fusobacterium sp.]
MDIKEVKKNAREKMKGFCNVCNECNGIWCAGKVPGMGGCGTGDSFKRNYNKLKRIRLILKTIHSAKNPNLETSLWGEKLSFPGIVAPITGASYNFGNAVNEEEYANNIINGAIDAGTIGMVGDGGDPTYLELGLKAIKKAGGKGVAIIKPRDNEEIIKRIKIAEEAGAIAVGIDIDGAGLLTMALYNQPVGPKSFKDLKTLVDSTDLPFIVKGILSVEEAKLCQKAGVDTIVVSNHGGRILDDTLAPCEVLNEIVREVGYKVNILVDGAARNGGDILKYLALGAKGVLIGRPIIWGSVGGGQEGVKIILEQFKNELYKNMILTGCEETTNISPRIIHEFILE